MIYELVIYYSDLDDNDKPFVNYMRFIGTLDYLLDTLRTYSTKDYYKGCTLNPRGKTICNPAMVEQVIHFLSQ